MGGSRFVNQLRMDFPISRGLRGDCGLCKERWGMAQNCSSVVGLWKDFKISSGLGCVTLLLVLPYSFNSI